MMSNLMPSLASMDNKSLLANLIALSILVITLTVNAIIQTRTHVIGLYEINVGFRRSSWFAFCVNVVMIILPYVYMGMLLFLLIIFISSAITIPTSKRILEIKYQAIRKTILVDQQNQQISTVNELRLLVKKYWIMAETGSPQFVMTSNPLSSASSVICALSTLMYMFAVWFLVWFRGGPYLSVTTTTSVYKWSMIAIVVTQSIGVVVGSIAPISRCFTVLISFKSFAKDQKRNHFSVFKVDKYWTQTLFEWQESRISVLSGGRRSRALVHKFKNRILRFFIRFQRGVVVSCKIIRLLPIAVAFLFVRVSCYFNSVKKMLFNTSTASSSSVDTHEDLSEYVLLLEDNTQLDKKTMKGISDSMNRLIQKAEKKQHKNLLKFLDQSFEEYDASNGVMTFDNDQFQSQLSIVEHNLNSWSLPIISLTCIAIALPNIEKELVDNVFKSVGEGLLYTHLVEEILNREPVYVNIRRASLALWHEVEVNCKWLKNTLDRSAYIEKTPREIIDSFAQMAEKVLNEFNASTNGDLMENESLPPKVIAANSMYRIAKTIMNEHGSSNNSNVIDEDELFTRLCGMIADILATCFTNIPRAISVRCHESTVEKREARVAAAIDFLGRTTEIIERLENRQLPNMDHDKMAYIDEWRLYFKHP